MKKIFSIILIVTLLVSNSILIYADSEDSKEISTYAYPITTESAIWKAYTTHDQKVEACRIPQSTLDNLSTEGVLKAILDYPLFFDFFAYSDWDTALKKLQVECDALAEFLSRDDSNQVLNRMNKSNEFDEVQAHLINLLRGYILDSDITPRLSVRTPNGSSVTVYTLGEISATERKQLDDYAKKAYPNATLISNSTAKYNCHSYAWYLRDANNIYWMNDPSLYMSDGSYTKIASGVSNYTAIASNDIIYYTDHSAVSHTNGGSTIKYITVYSKWGQGPLMSHRVHDCPYSLSNVSVWRR
ncbi:MAG TPA: hypothetical protein IAC14_05810 [Candidatus Scybalomonas excrementigallinarum]|jgi:hypothetical protein|nr:hypothetical protein [Candidatus Scybalomonas excrementigallinarum]